MISGYANGYSYPEERDMEEVCGKCTQAYFGDFLPQDCDNCTFKQTVELCRKYAEKLGDLDD